MGDKLWLQARLCGVGGMFSAAIVLELIVDAVGGALGVGRDSVAWLASNVFINSLRLTFSRLAGCLVVWLCGCVVVWW